MRQLSANFKCLSGEFVMARFTTSSLKSPLPAWHSRSISSENCCSSIPAAMLSSSTSFHTAPGFLHQLHSLSSSSPNVDVDVLRSTQGRLMRFKSTLGVAGSRVSSLRGYDFSPIVNFKNNGRRLICSRASLSSSINSGMPLLF